MANNHWGPTPWVGSEAMTRMNQRFSENDNTDNKYSTSAPIFNDFYAAANLTPEGRQARVARFGVWNLPDHVDDQRGHPANHLEAQFRVAGTQDPDRVPPSFNGSIEEQMLDGAFMSEVCTDLNEECIAQDLPASVALFHHQQVLTDARRENRDLIRYTDLFTSNSWLELFSQRYWVFFLGDYQERSLHYPNPVPTLPIYVRISVPDESGAYVPGPRINHDLVLSPAGMVALNLLLTPLNRTAAEPPELVVNTWWSEQMNPPIRTVRPLQGPTYGYQAYLRMFRRVFTYIHYYNRPRSDIYFGRFPATLLTRDVLGQKTEHLPALEPDIPFTQINYNRHWWCIIVDSYTGNVYQHESLPPGGMSGPVTARFIHNVNRVLRDLPPEQVGALVQRRALKPHTDQEDIMAWETTQRQSRPQFRAYHIQSLRAVTHVPTVRQSRNGADCGLFVLNYMRNFINSLSEGIVGAEKNNLNVPPFNVAAARRVIHTTLNIHRELPPPNNEDSLDSIGQQLGRHPGDFQRALWHLENAGAILISYTNTETRVRNNPEDGAEVFQLPPCVPRVDSSGRETCNCGFSVIPVPDNHKVILHSTKMQDLADATAWEESELGKLSEADIAQARVDILAATTFVEGTPEYTAALGAGALRKKALETRVLVHGLPRLLVGRNSRGPRAGCRGGFVMSNHTPAMVAEDNNLKACGYRMENPNQTNVLGPFPYRKPYPLCVNEGLWAWVSRETTGTETQSTSTTGNFLQRSRIRARRLCDNKGGTVVSREAHQDSPTDHYQIPVIAENRGFWEDARISTAGTQAEALARNLRREAQEIGFAYYAPYNDNYDSFDETLPLTSGILPRKVRRTRNIERNKRKLYEHSDSEYDTDGAFDPTGQCRNRKRFRQSALPQNALTYVSVGAKVLERSLPVAPCYQALDWYINTHQTRVRTENLLKEQQMLRGRMQIRVLIKHTNGAGGKDLNFRTGTLPKHILLQGFRNLIRYLKEPPHDMTEPGEEPNVVPQMGETDELEYMTTTGIAPLDSEVDFAAFCENLDVTWNADHNATCLIQISRWPSYCMNEVDFTFTHGGLDHPIPRNMLNTLGGVESGIQAYISQFIGSQFEFTLDYRQMMGGVFEQPQTYWGIHEPIVNGIRVIDPAQRLLVNITLNIRALNTIILHEEVNSFGGIITLHIAALETINVYLTTHFTQLEKFKQFCASRSRRLEFENPQLCYNTGLIPGVFVWTPLNTQELWDAFLLTVIDGAPFEMAFRRPIFCTGFVEPTDTFGGTIRFRFGQRSVGPDVMVPAAVHILRTDIINIPAVTLGPILFTHAATRAPYSHVICDGSLPTPHENTFSYAPPDMAGILGLLRASLVRGDFVLTRIVIYGWMAGSAAEAALRVVSDAARVVRDAARAADDVANPTNLPRDARWVQRQQQLVADYNKKNPPVPVPVPAPL